MNRRKRIVIDFRYRLVNEVSVMSSTTEIMLATNAPPLNDTMLAIVDLLIEKPFLVANIHMTAAITNKITDTKLEASTTAPN